MVISSGSEESEIERLPNRRLKSRRQLEEADSDEEGSPPKKGRLSKGSGSTLENVSGKEDSDIMDGIDASSECSDSRRNTVIMLSQK